jgi:hypothetical protein
MSAVLAIGPASAATIIMAAVRERYRPLRHAELLLADRAASTPRAARNWLAGDCAPRIEHLVELMATDPQIEAVVMDLVANRRAERCG